MCRALTAIGNPPKLWSKGATIYYGKPMLGKEKILGRALLPTKFFSIKATERSFNLLEHPFSTQADSLCSFIATWPQRLPGIVGVFKMSFCHLICKLLYCSDIT